MALDIACLYSTVVNTSGQRKFFSFLPPHGRWLAASEEFTVFGSILEAVQKDVDRVSSLRHIAAFEDAVARGDLEIVQTPAPIFQDLNTNIARTLQVAGGVLSVVDPCWFNSTSA